MDGGASLRVSLSAGCCAESLWMEGNKQSEKGTDDIVFPDSRAVFLRLRDIREKHSGYSPKTPRVIIVNMSFIKHMALRGPCLLPSPHHSRRRKRKET